MIISYQHCPAVLTNHFSVFYTDRQRGQLYLLRWGRAYKHLNRIIGWRSSIDVVVGLTKWAFTVRYLGLPIMHRSLAWIQIYFLTTKPVSGATEYDTVRTLPSGNKTEYWPTTWSPSLVSCWLKSLQRSSFTAYPYL